MQNPKGIRRTPDLIKPVCEVADTYHRYWVYSTGRFDHRRALMATPDFSRHVAAVVSPTGESVNKVARIIFYFLTI